MKYLSVRVMNVKTSVCSYYNVWYHFPGDSYPKLKMSRYVWSWYPKWSGNTLRTDFSTTLMTERYKGRGRKRRLKYLRDDIMEKRRHWNL